jgi:hypothetical protein
LAREQSVEVRDDVLRVVPRDQDPVELGDPQHCFVPPLSGAGGAQVNHSSVAFASSFAARRPIEAEMDIGTPDTEREVEVSPLEEPVPTPLPAEEPAEAPLPA